MAGSLPKNRDLLLCIKTCHPDTRITEPAYVQASKSCLQMVFRDRGLDFTEESITYTSRRFSVYVKQLFTSRKINSHFDRLKKCDYFDRDLVLRTERVPDSSVPKPPPLPPSSPIKTRKTYDQN